MAANPNSVAPFRGRANPPTTFSEGVARKLCERLMLGESLRAVCESRNMPNKRTVARWLADPKLADFREMYYHARRVQAEIRVDEIFEIADDTSKDWKPEHNKDGDLIGFKPDNEAIQRSRVRIDTRKWYASKMVPKIYGEKQQIDHDVTGDLAELMKSASNNDEGLPPPIEGHAEVVE